MKDKFTSILDWIEKFFKRFRALIFLILACTIIFYVVTGKISTRQALESAKETAEKISGLNFEKDILIAEKTGIRNERDSLKEENYRIKEERDLALEEKNKAESQSAKDNRDKNEALRLLRLVASDDSYIFLDTKAYPFIGEKEYGFNATQVSGIHETFIENEFNKDIIQDQIAEIDHCNDALSLTMKTETMGEEIEKSYEEELAIDSTILSVEEEKTDILTDALKKDKRKERWKKIWGVTEKILYGVGGFLLGSAIK